MTTIADCFTSKAAEGAALSAGSCQARMYFRNDYLE